MGNIEKTVKEIIELLWMPCVSCDKLLFQEFNYCPYCGKKLEARFTSTSKDDIVVKKLKTDVDIPS